MLLRQVPTTRFNSAGYVGQLSLQRPAHEWLTANARWEMKKMHLVWGNRV